MKFYLSFTLLLLSSGTSTAQITRSECVNQGGEVVGDIGNGAIFRADYVCENSGQAPSDTVIPDDTNDPLAVDGEVCCGGTGEGINVGGGGTFGSPNGEGAPGGQPCSVATDCPVVQCFVPPCPDVICQDGTCTIDTESGNPECVQDSDCPPINCFVAPCDVNVCNAGVCELQPPPEDSNPNFVGEGPGLDRPVANRQECTEELGGQIVGDIGNGAIWEPGYVCESTGQPPIANIQPAEGEPIAFEGEVCCGPPSDDMENGRDVVTRQECTEEHAGVIVGDIGNGAIFAPNYICETNGEPPIADVVPSPGEPIASEGEVCCGSGSPMDKPTQAPFADTSVTPDIPDDVNTTSDADSVTNGSMVAAVIATGALFVEVFVGFFIEDAWA